MTDVFEATNRFTQGLYAKLQYDAIENISSATHSHPCVLLLGTLTNFYRCCLIVLNDPNEAIYIGLDMY